MKVGVVSDTHRMKIFMDKAIPYLRKCDLIVHAGDNFSDSKYIHKETKVPIMAVKGNCDIDNVEEELIFDIEDKKVFLCHGDTYGVKYSIDSIEERAKCIGADIIIFGHTHIPLYIEKDNKIYINPGSVSLPREVNYRSFMILNFNEGKVDIEQIKL